MSRETIERTLKKLWWVSGRSLEDVTIDIIDRSGGQSNVNEVKLSKDTEILKDRIIIGEKVIPHHRIVAIKYRGKVVWKRKGYA